MYLDICVYLDILCMMQSGCVMKTQEEEKGKRRREVITTAVVVSASRGRQEILDTWRLKFSSRVYMYRDLCLYGSTYLSVCLQCIYLFFCFGILCLQNDNLRVKNRDLLDRLKSERQISSRQLAEHQAQLESIVLAFSQLEEDLQVNNTLNDNNTNNNNNSSSSSSP